MAIIYPNARLEFIAEPDLGFQVDGTALVFLLDSTQPYFDEEPDLKFDFDPFDCSFVPKDDYHFLGIDGEVLGVDGVPLTW